MRQAIILAAGESSRFWPLNTQHKSLLKIMGRPLIWHTIEGLKKAGIKDIIIIQGPRKDMEKELSFFSKELSSLEIKYLVQPEPKGMGDAIFRAKDFLQEEFFVLNAERVDVEDYIKPILEKHKSSGTKLVLLGAETDKPQLYGILDFAGDRAKRIIEKPEKGKEPSNMKVVGVYLLPREFLDYYKRIPEHIYAFEDALSLYMREKDTRLAISREKDISLKYPWHLFSVTKYLLEKKLGRKKVYIGKNVKIFEGAVIKGPCYIGDNCIVGNNALVRDYTDLEEGAMVGAQAEVARCVFQKNTHIHSGYLGDSIFGENCRVGAGTVTGNIRLNREEIKSTIKGEKIGTGLNTLGVIVGNDTKIGINASLMPGILIGSNCIIGPASVVFENIEDDTTFFTNFEGIKKKNI